ncbi:cytochrome D1 domain-containing protein [Benzoatithermus flavus]|uniref:Cytochrome D1 domain-containing protein n=1 Tax=Benzoatithermus flavus TaxID=3108223 RepID=A0ABU8XZ18_9PROT
MRKLLVCLVALLLHGAVVTAAELRGTGDLGIVIERAAGSVQIVETTHRVALGRVEGLGDLSHASAVFSRDGRYAYVFGRDGGLTKVDLLERRIANRVVQAGNSIGGAISDDGSLVAVANYEPGGVKVFDAETLTPVADIPSVTLADGKRAKVVGLEDSGHRRFAFSLYEAGQTWLADLADPAHPKVERFENVGKLPYDALVTPDGRFYIAGLFGEDGLALIDLWHPEKGATHILEGYDKGEEPLPVYKMPHLEGWAEAGDLLFLPAIGRHELLVVERRDWQEVGRIPVHGQPVFAEARPDGRQVWVNFAHPDNDVVQVIDVPTLRVVDTLRPGKAVLHLEFTPRGEQVWISARDSDEVVVYDTETRTVMTRINAAKPSGIFFTARANRIGL